MAAYANFVTKANQRTGVPTNIIHAVIQQESGGNPNAGSTNPVSGQFDGGLMQINAATFNDLKQRNSYIPDRHVTDPEANILAGASYLRELHDSFGSWEWALRAYNSGPQAAEQLRNQNMGWNNGPNGTDPNYVTNVMQRR